MKRELLFLIVLMSAGVGAVRPAAGEDADLLGRRVRVDTGAPARLVGTVTEVGADKLLIQTTGQGGTTMVSREAIRGLEASDGYRRHTVRGLVGGAVAWGVLVGLYAAFDTLDESGVGEPLVIGGMVATGGIVGSLIKTERWQRLPLSAVSLRVNPRKRGAGVELVLSF